MRTLLALLLLSSVAACAEEPPPARAPAEAPAKAEGVRKWVDLTPRCTVQAKTNKNSGLEKQTAVSVGAILRNRSSEDVKGLTVRLMVIIESLDQPKTFRLAALAEETIDTLPAKQTREIKPLAITTMGSKDYTRYGQQFDAWVILLLDDGGKVLDVASNTTRWKSIAQNLPREEGAWFDTRGNKIATARAGIRIY